MWPRSSTLPPPSSHSCTGASEPKATAFITSTSLLRSSIDGASLTRVVSTSAVVLAAVLLAASLDVHATRSRVLAAQSSANVAPWPREGMLLCSVSARARTKLPARSGPTRGKERTRTACVKTPRVDTRVPQGATLRSAPRAMFPPTLGERIQYNCSTDRLKKASPPTPQKTAFSAETSCALSRLSRRASCSRYPPPKLPRRSARRRNDAQRRVTLGTSLSKWRFGRKLVSE